MNRINIEDLKNEHLNKTYNSLTVIDVIRDKSNAVMFRCKCSCGNTTDIPYRRVLRNAVKSCGCRSSTIKRLDLDKLKEDFVGKTINWLTVLDVYRDDNGIVMFKCQCKCGNIKSFSKKSLTSKGARVSCGCYKSSKEKGEQKSQYYKDHPELIDRLSKKRKQFYKDNPNAARQIGLKNKQLYIDDPTRRSVVGKRISDWFKNNPDEVAEWDDHRRKYFKEHPEIGEARSQLYKDHPEIAEKISLGNKKFNKENPDKVERINELNRQAALKKRLASNYDVLISVIRPDAVYDLLSGNIKAYSIIYTKCPICGVYAPHKMSDVYALYKADFKGGKAPMCKSCHVNLMSCFTSKYEQEIADYVSEFYNGPLIKNDRTILNGKELDLFYPEKKIAIEFNGDYWHDEDHKPANYHLNKFKLCLEKNIILVSIFELEWVNRKNDIILYLKDLFNCVRNNLSFDKEGYMNNNYPSFECEIDLSSHTEGVYTFGDLVVHTCGYSKLVNSSNKD